jgi:excisionase family DNA binding protein
VEFLTVNEIAERLRLNPQTIRNWIDAGNLPAYRVGGRRVRVSREDFDAFVRAREELPPSPPALQPAAIWDGEIPAPTIPLRW